ncbi:MAG: hypothetical protein GY856_39915 [bacterium]|nr:hypothetical protein [bacterium]
MSERDELSFEQVVYGSISGRRDYDILAHSADFSRAELELVWRRSGVTGSLQTAADPAPVYTFYPLDPAGRRRAFARTQFVGRGRGNDYVVHVLAADAGTFDALRWDVFLLEELGLLHAAKPDKGTRLEPVTVSRAEAEAAEVDAQPGDDPASPRLLAGVLRELAAGSLALRVGEARWGSTLLRQLLRVLPPDDRRELPFSTSFSSRHFPDPRLITYTGGDEEDLRRYVTGIRTLVDPRRLEEAAPEGLDAFDDWVALSLAEMKPIFGLSVLREPRAALAKLRALYRWQRSGQRPSEPRQTKVLIDLATHPLNRRLADFDSLASQGHTQVLRQRIAEAVSQPEHVVRTLVLLFRQTKRRDPAGRSWEQVFAGARRTQADAGDRTAAVVIALLGWNRPDLVCTAGDAALRGSEEAAAWLVDLRAIYPGACEELVAEWLRAWSQADRDGCLEGAGELLKALSRFPETGVALLLLDVLETDAAPAAPSARPDWFLALVRSLRPQVLTVFSQHRAARIAAREGLLPRLRDTEVVELIPSLITRYTSEVVSAYDWKRQPGMVVLRTLAEQLEALLLAGDSAPPGDMESEPLRELVSLVAWKTGCGAKPPADLAWLAWATMMRWTSDSLSDPQAERLAAALAALMATGPAGVMHVVVWALFRLTLRRPEAVSLIDGELWAWAADRAIADARTAAFAEIGADETILRLTWLDGIRNGNATAAALRHEAIGGE